MAESNAQRVAKNTGFLFIRTTLVLLVSLYTSRVVLRTLGFEDFGLYNVVGSVVVFFSFLQTALTNATYRYLAYELGTGNTAQLRKVYSMAINSHILLAIILFIILEAGGVWFLNNKLNIPPDRLNAANWAFQFSVITFCANVVRTPYNSNIIAHEHMNFYALVSIVEVLLRLCVVFLLVWSPVDKLITYAALLSVVAAFVLLCYAAYCHYSFKDCRYSWHWDGNLIRQFSSYSGWSMVVNISDVATSQCMSIFFFNFLGAVANAALGIANQVIGALTQFLHTFTQAFNPQIIKHYAAGHKDTFMRMIYSTSKISYFLLLLFSVPVVVNIHYILSIWLGDYPSYTPGFVQMIIVYSLINSFQAPLLTAVHATGKIRTHQILMSSIKVLAIPSIWLILYCGGTGMGAIAIWVVLNLACAVVRTLYMHRLIGLDLRYYFSKVLVKIVTISILVIPLAYLATTLLGETFFGFMVSSLLSTLLICGFGYGLGLNSEERKLIKSFPLIKKFAKQHGRNIPDTDKT